MYIGVNSVIELGSINQSSPQSSQPATHSNLNLIPFLNLSERTSVYILAELSFVETNLVLSLSNLNKISMEGKVCFGTQVLLGLWCSEDPNAGWVKKIQKVLHQNMRLRKLGNT